MPSAPYSFRSSILTTLLRFRRPDVPLRVALRAAAVVTLPLAAGVATGHETIGLGIGAGAFNVMFSDQPGPYGQRLRRVALASLAAAVAALAGFLLGAHAAPLVLAIGVCGFLGGMLVIFGADSARVGMISMILLAVAASTPLPWRDAVGASGLILIGGLLLAVVSVLVWPLQRYRPEREALAQLFRELAQLARHRGADDDPPPLTETINQVRHMLLQRGPTRGRAMEAMRVLLDLAERMRLELLAIGQLRNAPGLDEARIDSACARVLEILARSLEHAEPPARARQALAHMQDVLDGMSQPHTQRARLQALIGQLRAAIRNANWAGSRGELRASSVESRLPRALRGASPWATLRANIHRSSVGFRHAMRCAVCLMLAQWLARATALPHGYWLPMTAAIVLRPDFGGTFSIGLLRIAGTILGLLLTSLLLAITPHTVWPQIIWLALLCFTFRYLATAHYGIAVAALTGAVVILLSFEGTNPNAAVLARVLNTALGSTMALLAYMVWPTWERTRSRAALADMLQAYAGYLGTLVHGCGPQVRNETRSAARLARSNAQASLDRLRAEPGVRPALLAFHESLFAHGNRLVRTAMSLEAVLEECATHPQREPLDAFVQQSRASLMRCADDLRRQHAAGSERNLRQQQIVLAELLRQHTDDPASSTLITLTDRVADNINTLGYVLYGEESSPAVVSSPAAS